MSWYWIVLIVVCYILLSIVTCLVFSRVAENTENEVIVLLGIIWPLVVIVLPIVMFIILLDKIVDEYKYKEE